jgi:hypothetical protein
MFRGNLRAQHGKRGSILAIATTIAQYRDSPIRAPWPVRFPIPPKIRIDTIDTS